MYEKYHKQEHIERISNLDTRDHKGYLRHSKNQLFEAEIETKILIRFNGSGFNQGEVGIKGKQR